MIQKIHQTIGVAIFLSSLNANEYIVIKMMNLIQTKLNPILKEGIGTILIFVIEDQVVIITIVALIVIGNADLDLGSKLQVFDTKLKQALDFNHKKT